MVTMRRHIEAEGAGTALLVEDQPQIRAVFAKWLADTGRCVFACRNFQEARAFLASHTPDMLVTDIRLNDYNGLQLVLQLLEKQPDAVCVVITGYDDTVLRREAEQMRATYLVKPVDRAHFLAALDGQAVSP
jgi:two-component system response regulator RegA